MSFLVRPVRTDDLLPLMDLTKQFSLLNLPSDRKAMSKKIECSLRSFAGELPKEKAEYLFVLEDVEEQAVVGSSLIIAKHGTDEIPHSFFKIYKRNHFSEDLGIGFIHQVLRFETDEDGPTEIGGLLVDRAYRRLPDKLGKQISLMRFMYIALHPERFEKRILCEPMGPVTEDGRSEFWEALGRRFTSLPYQEADLLSQSHKEFIHSLFPKDDIYLCLLDSKARTVLGRVGEATKPAQHLLESIGFEYREEVDPFDGGPHYDAQTENILPIKFRKTVIYEDFENAVYKSQGLVALEDEGHFRGALVSYELRGNKISIPHKMRDILQLKVNSSLILSPFDYKTSIGEQT